MDTNSENALTIEDMIGRRIRQLRGELPPRGEVSQAEFGRRLAQYLAKPWPRQSVSHAEAGNRAFTAVELIAMSKLFGISVDELLRPPAGVEDVTFPSGEPWRPDGADGASNNAQDGFADLAYSASLLNSATKTAHSLTDAVSDALTSLQRAIDVLAATEAAAAIADQGEVEYHGEYDEYDSAAFNEGGE